MKLSEVLGRARSEPEDRRTILGQHLSLITGLSSTLLDLSVDDYQRLADGYRVAALPRTGQAPHVVAAVLTRNEEASIRGCLEALADDADRVLLIDADSEDSTVDVARSSFRNLVHVSRPWTDDFAAQRNTAFDHVSGGGWLAYVDADETLAPESVGSLRAALAALDHVVPEADLVVSPRIADRNGATHLNTLRVFRAGTQLRFKGRIHERPYDADGNTPPSVGVRVTFQHAGYLPEVIRSKRKAENYARIVSSCMAEEPGNPKWRYYAVRDSMVTKTFGPAEARAAFHLLRGSLDKYQGQGLGDYETERYTDTLVLLCDLALRFGGQKEIAEIALALMAQGHTLEATFYSSFAEFSGLLSRASRLLDQLAQASRSDHCTDSKILGRSQDLQALIAISCGRYEEVATFLSMARGNGAGKLTEQTLRELRTHLPG